MIEDIIKDLQLHAESDGTLTRQHYRQVGAYTIHAIQSKFGTFRAARRAAGLEETVGARQFHNQLARHVDHDVYRQMNVDRSDYADKYKRTDTKRFQTVIVASDLHDKHCDSFWLRVFIDTIKRVQPDKIVINGDFYDLPEWSRYTGDPRNWDPVGGLKAGHEILKKIREACPSCELILVEGNHEVRFARSLAETNPALKAVLSDLHGFTVPKLFGLDKFEVRYVASADLAVFNKSNMNTELEKNYCVLYDGAFITHHFPHGKDLGCPGISGHHHKHQVWPMHNLTYGYYEWHQLSGGHKRIAEYCNGEIWGLGFAEVNIDTQKKLTNITHHPITDHACIGGKWYVREPNEI